MGEKKVENVQKFNKTSINDFALKGWDLLKLCFSSFNSLIDRHKIKGEFISSFVNVC